MLAYKIWYIILLVPVPDLSIFAGSHGCCYCNARKIHRDIMKHHRMDRTGPIYTNASDINWYALAMQLLADCRIMNELITI